MEKKIKQRINDKGGKVGHETESTYLVTFRCNLREREREMSTHTLAEILFQTCEVKTCQGGPLYVLDKKRRITTMITTMMMNDDM